MFFQLVWQECRQMVKGITYWLFAACLVLFCTTQMDGFPIAEKPVEGEESYGTAVYSKDESVIMEYTNRELTREFTDNIYVTYPLGVYKEVVLSEGKQKQMEEILQKAKDKEISYERYVSLMEEADKLLGGGSKYVPDQLFTNTKADRTYEDALKEYNTILYEDRVTNAAARLFCDYAGIILGIIPVFLAVTRCLRDGRAGASQVIYAKKISSFTIILSRYAAILLLIFLPLLLMGISPTLEGMYYAKTAGVRADILAYGKHIVGWIMPTVFIVTSVGFFVTELTDTPLAILIQAAWWYGSTFYTGGTLVGVAGMNLIPRFNTAGSHEIFEQMLPELVVNRLIYTAAGILLILLTVWVYDNKRKGVWDIHGKICGNRKKQSAA